MPDNLRIDCDEWRDLCDDFPAEMEVVTDMMIEAEGELCEEAAPRR
jgi:hypothetical protein